MPGIIRSVSSTETGSQRRKLDTGHPFRTLRMFSPRSPMSQLTLVRDEDDRDAMTDRQKEILDFISKSISKRGYPPTLREIGGHFGIRSTNGVNDHLRALEKKGYLQREDLKSRALRPIVSTGQLVEVPVLGRVAAGQPLLAVRNY